MVHFKIITAVHNSEMFIERCMASVMQQTYKSWEHIVIDDRSTDTTLPRALTLVGYEKGKVSQTRVIAQVHKQPSHLLNQCAAIDAAKPKNEDVIVMLDGDDWLFDNTVLQRLADYYEKTKCWMTYGTPMIYKGDDYPLAPQAWLRPYKTEVLLSGEVRQHPWLATHLRTFKFGLWRRIDQRRSFYLSNGEMAWCCVDFATMFPMLEMAQERSLFIPEPMMVYNTVNPISFHNRTPREVVLAVDKEIRNMTPYPRLKVL